MKVVSMEVVRSGGYTWEGAYKAASGSQQNFISDLNGLFLKSFVKPHIWLMWLSVFWVLFYSKIILK